MNSTYGMPMMLIPIPEEIKGYFIRYVVQHTELTQPEKNMLKYYYSDDTLMQFMGFTFFEQWQDVRNFTVEAWTLNVIEELLSAMEVIE